MKIAIRKNSHWYILTLLGLSIIGIWFTYMRPASVMHSAEKPLCDLVPPFEIINADELMDGGSIVLYVKDHQGHTAELFIPYDHSIQGFQHVYRNGREYGRNPADRFTDSKAAIWDVKSILRSPANDKSIGKSRLALECNSGALGKFLNKAMKIYDALF
jgi:hypothetical protein